MLLLAWLLSLLCVVGCYQDETKYYGKTFKMRLHSRAKMVDFAPSGGGYPIYLWEQDRKVKDNRRKVVGNYFTVYNLTQSDSGHYTVKDGNGILLSYADLEVVENIKSYTLKSGERLQFSFDLPPDSCFINFRPAYEDLNMERKVVTRGRLDWEWYNEECDGFELLPPCGLVNEDVQTSCKGTFTFIDGDSNTALRVDVEVEWAPVDLWRIGVSSAVVSLVVSCCCCVKRCCCKKSKKDEAAEGEPAVNLEEYQHEPAAARSYQNNPVTLYPALPSDAPAGPSEPLVHSPRPAMPPTYSEVSAPAGTSDAPTVTFPLDSGPEPRFELNGLTFDSPLNSNSSQGDVYTSDKLNFL